MMEESQNAREFKGLSHADIPALLTKYGKNEIAARSPSHFLRVVWDVVKEPMFLLLVLAASLYFILGDKEEGLLMVVAMVFVSGISIYQEMKSSKALKLLGQYNAMGVIVIREGVEETIASEDLLPGDIMILEEGDRVPADAEILQQNDLSVNESVITGESMPVQKNGESGDKKLYQGTTLNSGKCYALVTATGNETELGKLGKSVEEIKTLPTRLQIQIKRLVKAMTLFGLVAFVLIWLVNYLNTREFAHSLLFGLTLVMSAIPEEIPVAFTSFMALGAYRLAKQGVITRHPQTIENLGAATVICLDKTGTITQNKMQVKSIYDFRAGKLQDLNDGSAIKNSRLLLYARLASEAAPFDAMEKAIVDAYIFQSGKGKEILPGMIYEYPLSGRPPMMTHAYNMDGSRVVAGKGAPERIMRVCGLEADEKLKRVIISMGEKGYRVLGVCSATLSGDFPKDQDDFDWQFEGLLALYDPPKIGIDKVFNSWYDAGIKIKLITGDFAATSMTIARQVGLRDGSIYKTGEELMKLSEIDLQEAAETINVFVRMFPQAKMKVVQALNAKGETVIMTGDGVNDAPALKASDIGIAMGSKGTEIAREASGLVLTDDNLEKITVAIEQGRKVYHNLKKAMGYIISIHIPIILIASLPLLLGWKFPNIFTPVHVIFLELVMGPTCSIFFEREPVETVVMQTGPPSKIKGLFSWHELLISILQGLVVAIGLLALYYYFMTRDYNISYTRTVVFTTLIFCNILLTFVNRSFTQTLFTTIRYKNSLAPWVLLASVIFIIAIRYLPGVQAAFYLSPISNMHFLVCFLAAIVSVGWFELFKAFKLHSGSTPK
jgi:Ca2+-transporting ATPase